MNSNETHSLVRLAFAALFIIILLLVVYILESIASIVLLIFLGILLALFLNWVSSFISKKLHLPFGIALALFTIFILTALFSILWFSGPDIIKQFSTLKEAIPDALKTLQELLERNNLSLLSKENGESSGQNVSFLPPVFSSIAGVFSTTFGIIGSIVLIIFVGFYLAIEPDVYVKNVTRLFRSDRRQHVNQLLQSLGTALRWWLLGRIMSMTVVGVLTTLLLFIFGIDLALLLGLLAGTLSFIAYIGPIAAAIPAILVGLAEEPIQAVYVIAIYAFVQFIESYIITPAIQKRTVSMPPALLICVQVLMGILFGLLGVLVATPLTVAIIVTIQTLYIEDILDEDVKKMGQHKV